MPAYTNPSIVGPVHTWVGTVPALAALDAQVVIPYSSTVPPPTYLSALEAVGILGGLGLIVAGYFVGGTGLWVLAGIGLADIIFWLIYSFSGMV